MPDEPTPTTESAATEPVTEPAQTFTQADVDSAVEKIAAKIRAEERRKVSEKYADYDELKTKAEGAKTLEDRVHDLEARGTQSEHRALVAEIAAEFGIGTKRETDKDGNQLPSDADLFLTGADEATLRAQAQRFADRKPEPAKVPVTSDAAASGKATAVSDASVDAAPGLGTLRAAYAAAAKK